MKERFKKCCDFGFKILIYLTSPIMWIVMFFCFLWVASFAYCAEKKNPIWIILWFLLHVGGLFYMFYLDDKKSN